MTTITRYKTFIALVIAVFFLSMTAYAAQMTAGRNICRVCNTICAVDARACPECDTPLNLCLDCNTQNPATFDNCETCQAPLANMRVLATIDAEVREQLRLGQSERAVIDKELGKVDYRLKTGTGDRENLLFTKAKLLNSMKFYSRESEAWRTFLNEFPNSDQSSYAEVNLSEALRKWAYLLYTQKNITEAITLLHDATQTNPMNSLAWHWLGRLQRESGETAQAAESYLQSLKAEPGNRMAIGALRSMKVDIPKELLKVGK